MTNRYGRISRGAWRYRVMKHYLHRAQKFEMEANTDEERKAWRKVVAWFNSILKNKRLNSQGTIILPEVFPKEDIE